MAQQCALGYPFSPICPNGPSCSLSHLGSPIDCPTTIISTMKTARSTRIQQIATATIALLLIKYSFFFLSSPFYFLEDLLSRACMCVCVVRRKRFWELKALMRKSSEARGERNRIKVRLSDYHLAINLYPGFYFSLVHKLSFFLSKKNVTNCFHCLLFFVFSLSSRP